MQYLKLLSFGMLWACLIVCRGGLVTNPGFEDGDVGWGGSHTIVTSPVHSGSRACQYLATNNYAGTQNLSVQGGKTYRISGWIKTDANLSGTVRLTYDVRDASNTYLGGGTVADTRIDPGTDWTEVAEEIELPASATVLKVLLRTDSRTGLAWYDDVDVSEVTDVVNILPNGNFEDGSNGWSGSFSIVSSPTKAGSKALRYEPQASIAGVQNISVVGGQTYTISGWVKTDTALSGTVRIRTDMRDAGNTYLGGHTIGDTTVSPGTDWTLLSSEVTLPASATLLKIILRGDNRTGYAWFDDIQVLATLADDPEISAPANPPISGNWSATFEDNFDTSKLDGQRWKLGTASSFINGIAGIHPDQVTVSDGALTIFAEPKTITYADSSWDYASCELSTFKKFRQLYGYFEARLRYDAVRGMWPAFWTMPDRGNYGNVNNNRKAFIKFDLSGFSTPVNSAQIKLKVTAIESGGPRNLQIHAVSDGWSETGLAWDNMPTEDPKWLVQDYDLDPAVGDVLVYDVTDYINQQINGDKVASFALYDTFSRSVQITFGSREQSASSSRPRLTLDGTTITASEDTYARSGSYSTTHFGSSTDLEVKEQYGNTASTYDGGMEIDIQEALGLWPLNQVHHGIHWDGYGAQHQSQSWDYYLPSTETVEAYHTYGVYWEPGLLEFYVDGIKTATHSDSRVASVPAYMILSLQMGGWSGNDSNINPSDYPATMDIDYVKVWSGQKY